MSGMFLGNTIIEWQKRIEAEETKRKYNRIVPFFDPMSDDRSNAGDKENLFTRLFKRGDEKKTSSSKRKTNPCQDTQPALKGLK